MDTTVFDMNTPNKSQQKKNSSKKSTLAAGLTGGVAGAMAAVVIGQLTPEANAEPLPSDEENIAVVENEENPNNKPVWAVGDINVAHDVTDDMSFDEAFSAARAEVGSGGAFQWQGGVYGTYTTNEWNEMSVEDRVHFNDNFSWNHVDATSGNVATVQPIEVHHHHHHHHVEVVEVVESPAVDDFTPDGQEIRIVDAGPLDTDPINDDYAEIEVLGVVHDHETGANIGGLAIDNQEIYVIDVDGDLEFDLAASDFNHNNMVDDGEVIDIHGQGLTVEHLGGFTDPNDAIQASDDYASINDGDFSMPV